MLLIGDDPDFCRLVERLLSRGGFAVRIAKDRGEIVAALTCASLPDPVLLDVSIPATNVRDLLP